MTVRQRLSATRRAAIFDAHGGKCHLCGVEIKVGEKWEVEHPIPLALGGADDDSNRAPAHVSCHKPKSAKDAGMIAKAERMRQKHLGIRKAPTFWRPPGKYDWRSRRYVTDRPPRIGR